MSLQDAGEQGQLRARLPRQPQEVASAGRVSLGFYAESDRFPKSYKKSRDPDKPKQS